MSCRACLALHIFPHYLISGTIFDKELLNIKRVFCFSLQLSSATFPILRRTERCVIKNYFGVHIKHPSFLSEFNESWLFSKVFKKYSNIKSHEKPYSGSRVVQCGQADMIMPIVAFRNFANAPNTTDYSTFSSFAGHDWELFDILLEKWGRLKILKVQALHISLEKTVL